MALALVMMKPLSAMSSTSIVRPRALSIFLFAKVDSVVAVLDI
jgi:hypothetical protein